jgi:ribosomal protein S18 acetylase RimI-like enzyme
MSGLGLGVIVRPIKSEEVRAAAKLLFKSAEEAFRETKWNHSEQETLDWFESVFERWSEVWVAAAGRELAGVMCLSPGFLDQLFVAQNWQGRGVGTSLLDRAKLSCPQGFKLYVFQNNTSAVAFYDGKGLERGKSGISPDEGEPDYEYTWRP